MSDILLAKSHGGRTVAEHCRDVRAAADATWLAVSRDLAELGLVLPDNTPNLLSAAALLHDLLKANSSFQEMVAANGRPAHRQPVRHEVLAAVMLTEGGPLAGWLEQLVPDPLDRWAVVWAVAGHHFKMPRPNEQLRPPARLYDDAHAAREVRVRLSHPDVSNLLAETARAVDRRPHEQSYVDIVYDTADDPLRRLVSRYAGAASRQWDAIKVQPGVRLRLAVLKALLAAADAAGSALPERGLTPVDWAREALGTRLTPTDLDGPLAADAAKGFRPFQSAVAASDHPVTIVTAGCGNGKTTAAYLWAKKRAAGRKLFFTYPTTGTSTAGFQAYLAEQQGLPTDLIHSRADVDLADIHPTPEDGPEDRQARIDSLRAWTPKVVACTVDTVLGLLQNQRRGVYSFPAFAAGAFVFDELHSYDGRLFGGLLRFLEAFPKVPALLMSASIPPGRLAALQKLLGKRTGQVIPGDSKLESYKRYQLDRRDSSDDCWDAVVTALGRKRKVLWVCNTVGDAILAAAVARKRCITPVVYHSRFRYDDRRNRQNELITRFRGPDAVLAITTQVCEMSLDISADLLVTAECPLPALVQRLGRLNRYAAGDDPWPCLVYPFDGLPYNEDPKRIPLDGDCRASMAATRLAVADLGGQPCSQADLAARLKGLQEDETPDKYSAWLDDGWVTEPRPVREGDQTLTVVLERDRRRPRKELPRWTIPMPLWDSPKAFNGEAGPYRVPFDADISYSETEGAEWRKR